METTTQKQAPKDIVTRLRELAHANITFNSVAQVFALRERGRREVTVNSLYETLKQAGWEGSKSDVIGVLEKMSSLGIGRLNYDAKGKLRSLKDIRVTLQSIGKTALNDHSNLSKNTRQPNLKPLSAMPQTIVEKPVAKLCKAVPNPMALLKTTEEVKAVLTLTIGDKTVVLDIPVNSLK